MKFIPLTQGKQAIVDDEDFERVNQYKWFWDKNYGSRSLPRSGKNRRNIRMHRFIMDAKRGQFIDHKNGDKLDNRKSNLRFCTISQNHANRKNTARSGYKGVHFDGYRYNSFITIKYKLIRLGSFKTKIEAAKCYDSNAKKYYGRFARLNFPLKES
jgi:hypothetical protein